MLPAMPAGETQAERPETANDAVEALVSLKLYQRQVQASANVVAAAVLGFLLDIRA